MLTRRPGSPQHPYCPVHVDIPHTMTAPAVLARYDRCRTYAWNYDHAPEPAGVEVPPVPGQWRFCGLAVDSPLGVPAGPLLNGRWCLYYASLGFDVVTYKTVRSGKRACYELPNLQPVYAQRLGGGQAPLEASDQMHGSWAVSFGMPSKAPDVWRPDVQWTRQRLPAGKLLSVSVVGTVQEGWSLDQLADDYARCAAWAVQSGADCVETNLSCPNVSTVDGQLYQQPAAAALVAERVRDAIGRTPLIVKIGQLNSDEEGAALLEALAQHANALAMTNSVVATVADADGRLLFDGQRRGICGAAIRDASLAQTEMMACLAGERKLAVELIGVGGVSTADHVRAYLSTGAASVHIATAAMVNPAVAIEIRRQLAGGDGWRFDR